MGNQRDQQRETNSQAESSALKVGQVTGPPERDDLPEIAVPDPGPVGRALVDRLVAEAHDARAAARERLDAVTALYHRFGCGELDEDELIAALRALVTAPQGAQDAGE